MPLGDVEPNDSWSRFCERHPERLTPIFRDQAPGQARFCERCSTLETPISQALEYVRGVPDRGSPQSVHLIADLGSPSTWKEAQCALCHLFMTIHRSKLVEVDDNTPYVLKAFRNYNTRGIAITSPDVRDRMLENFAASGFITSVAPQAENDVGRHSVRLVPEMIDIRRLKDMVKRIPTRPRQGREVLPVDRNPRFRLIDCNTRKICPVPGTSLEGCEYVALSYVWGLGDNDTFTGDRLPNRVPAVINDALTITKNLGVGYLWVDRYCIDQTDEVDKTVQIQQMQAIYWNACFTIIAAAGSDPHYGLPGVSRPRHPNRQPCVRVAGKPLTWTMPDFDALILRSRWNTRAWTYQEMYFSWSSLIFTDYY